MVAHTADHVFILMRQRLDNLRPGVALTHQAAPRRAHRATSAFILQQPYQGLRHLARIAARHQARTSFCNFPMDIKLDYVSIPTHHASSASE
ncbi:MAG: hypothetical protein ACYDCJ_09635 [Gammaproteobacteria bacterium]